LTVVELFQSQGCSSCPPANDNVILLADDSDKLMLTYEVTYWDYIGWPDTFGKKEWDVRQRDYSYALKNRNVYTPQVIVNGLANGVGSRKGELSSLLADGASSPYASTVTITASAAQITISGPASTRGIVQLVFYDPTTYDVYVQRGENRGRTLPHRNIVRELLVLGWWEGGELSLPLPDLPGGTEGLRKAVLVQRGRGGPILGAAKI
ncbi:thioredoxin-like protein, partial [Vararia minispora EC-137]